jgi:hypothetical protein
VPFLGVVGDYFQPLLLTFSNEGKVNDRKI